MFTHTGMKRLTSKNYACYLFKEGASVHYSMKKRGKKKKYILKHLPSTEFPVPYICFFVHNSSLKCTENVNSNNKKHKH